MPPYCPSSAWGSTSLPHGAPSDPIATLKGNQMKALTVSTRCNGSGTFGAQNEKGLKPRQGTQTGCGCGPQLSRLRPEKPSLASAIDPRDPKDPMGAAGAWQGIACQLPGRALDFSCCFFAAFLRVEILFGNWLCPLRKPLERLLQREGGSMRDIDKAST